MSKICLINQPSGLGDIFFSQKIAQKWLDAGYEVVWPVEDHYYAQYDKMEFLDGDVNLLDSTGASIVERDSGQWDMTSSSIDYTSTFNEDASENWKIDSDKLGDISDDRG